MDIKHRISFRLQVYGKKKDHFLIRLRVTFNCQRLDVATNCQISDITFWDEQQGMVIDGYRGPKGETAVSINRVLRHLRDEMETVFKFFEVNSFYPTIAQVKEQFDCRTKGIQPPKPKTDEKKNAEYSFFKVFDQFTKECGEKNAWTKATYQKMSSLRNDLYNFKRNIKLSEMKEPVLTSFVVYLRDQKILRTPRKRKEERKGAAKEDMVGLRNSTIKKKLGYLTWFLNWATDMGYNKCLEYRRFRPTLKETQKKIVYLTAEELNAIHHLELSEENLFLEPVRDIFLFCCFSSLRYSDAAGLRWNDVKEEHIEVTTVKTADSITIEINDIMRTILEKYGKFPERSGYVFPHYTNQAMNRDLKVLARLAGLDDDYRITTYKGNFRTDEIKKKWQLIGTHTGRRTFIVNALSRGISPNVVMKWTGHASYDSMKPYIDIVDSIKASEMTKMNFLN